MNGAAPLPSSAVVLPPRSSTSQTDTKGAVVSSEPTGAEADPTHNGSASWVWGRYSRFGLGVALIACAIDQINKWWMLEVYGIAERGRVEALPFMDLVFVLNRGISYSLFTLESQQGQYLLASFAFLVAVVLIVLLARTADTAIAACGYGLIVGGAIGNAIDRLHLGGVADFYSLHAFGHYWYVFNIADVAIVAGVVALLLDTLVLSRDDASPSP